MCADSRVVFPGCKKNCHVASSIRILIDNSGNCIMIVLVFICFRFDKKARSNKILSIVKSFKD